MLLPRSDDAISPTGHYTGYTWVRAGWSDPALATLTGRLMYDAGRLPLGAARRLGMPSLEGMLLGRHRSIDEALEEAVEAGRIGQVLELASGLSPRGLTFTRRYPDLVYVEADLPGMAATKRKLLARTGPLAPGHRVVTVDAFADVGPSSLRARAEPLDHDRGLAVITEGLLNYFPTPAVTGLWSRTAEVLHTFPSGLYLADIGLRTAAAGPGAIGPVVGTALAGLSALVRARLHLHFGGTDGAEAALRAAGFDRADVRPIADWPAAAEWSADPVTRRVHVLAAETGA